MKVTKLSYKRIQLEYHIQVFGRIRDSLVFSDTINISVRYNKMINQNNKYVLLGESASKWKEYLHFRYKVGKLIISGSRYSVKGININYDKNITVNMNGRDLLLDEVPSYIEVDDPSFLASVRDRKLENLFK